MSSLQSTSAYQIHCVFCQKNDIALSSEWLAPTRFLVTLDTYVLCIYSNTLQFLFSSFSPCSSTPSLICRFEFYPTALRPFHSLTSTVCWSSLSLSHTLSSLASAAQSEILDAWDELYDLSHGITGSVLIWSITCDVQLRWGTLCCKLISLCSASRSRPRKYILRKCCCEITE